jgi:hypothetical protein
MYKHDRAHFLKQSWTKRPSFGTHTVQHKTCTLIYWHQHSFLTYTRTVTKFSWPKLFLRTWMFLLFIYFSCLWRKKECKGRKMTIPYMFCRSFCIKLQSLGSDRCRHTLLNCMKRQSSVTSCCVKKNCVYSFNFPWFEI